eukprot:NODE_6566_length_502_cov_30.814570_g5784_i0.p2 GENE.NODE_6566_length_502_cov_30.814570_g5784_i0~~NODE_6566_length_502_cov_30.814570_g5784_i0.p2  ORF type:complete len:104 (-),score=26.83 NODE_6566_length_502_cov_30.814570_g5784_i0:189-470(-)
MGGTKPKLRLRHISGTGLATLQSDADLQRCWRSALVDRHRTRCIEVRADRPPPRPRRSRSVESSQRRPNRTPRSSSAGSTGKARRGSKTRSAR